MGGLDKSGNFIFKPPFKPFCFHLGCEIQTKLDFFSTFCRKLFVYTRSNPSDTSVSRLGGGEKGEKKKGCGLSVHHTVL